MTDHAPSEGERGALPASAPTETGQLATRLPASYREQRACANCKHLDAAVWSETRVVCLLGRTSRELMDAPEVELHGLCDEHEPRTD